MDKYLQYIEFAKNDKKVPRYVKLQCLIVEEILFNKNEQCYFCKKTYNKIKGLMEMLKHPDVQGSIIVNIDDYAYFFIMSVFCIKLKINDEYYYQKAILEIGRKNRKTFYVGVIFIILMLLSKPFSRFYSVAPDYKLSSEIRVAIRKILKSTPSFSKHFKIKRDMIECKITDTEFTPLAYSNDRMDGKLAQAFLSDETGAMDSYPVEAMTSSQIGLANKLGFIISTQYPNDNNGFIDEIDMAKRVLDNKEGVVTKRIFSLLYEPDADEQNKWEKSDLALYQANPIAIYNKEFFEDLLKKRAEAILYENKKENFLCKHLNIKYKGLGTDGYVDIEKLKKCKIVDDADFFKDKNVYIGLDLSQTDDNTSIAIVCEHKGDIYAKVYAFYPSLREEIKSKKENVNYKKLKNKGCCFACGEDVVDYMFIEQFILNLDTNISAVGYDRYNAISTVQKLESNGIECIEIKQHSSVLHSATKWLFELIMNKKFHYFENELLEINFTNARCTYDTNMNRYVNKKRSNGKVDMVVALINAIHLLEKESINGSDFVSMRI